MTIKHAPFYKSITENTFSDRITSVTIDHNDNVVYIPKSSLLNGVTKNCLPYPDLALATNDLIKRDVIKDKNIFDEGWILPLSYFDNVVSLWKKENLKAV